MSAREIAALGAPVVAVILLVRTLYEAWWWPMALPLQFGAAAGSGALVLAAHRPLVKYLAAGGLLVACVGLIAVLARDQWIARGARSLMRWEDFDRDFRAYAETAGERRNRPASAT